MAEQTKPKVEPDTSSEAQSDNSKKSPEPAGEAKVAEKMIKDEVEKEKKAEDADKEKKVKEMVKEDKEAMKDDKGRGRGKGGDRKRRSFEPTREEIVDAWIPKTKLGKEVKAGKVKDIDEILDSGKKILEPQIIDKLLAVKTDLVAIGQSKGKFGGGKRRAWRQTQRKTKEGNVPTFSAYAVVGDSNSHVGIGVGRSGETLPARDKAMRKAKLNIIKISRGCAAFDCSCSELHTVPFEVEGKAGSVKVKLIPAPQGTGLVVASELKKILSMAGIHDVYSRTSGKQRTTFNLIKACMNALGKTTSRDKEEGK